MTEVVDFARRRRWVSTSATWLVKVRALLTHDAADCSPDERWLIGYDAARFLDEVIDTVEALVPLLNDDEHDVESFERRLRRFAQDLRARRLAAKLQNVEGRTAAEAELFMRKAEDLLQAPR